MKTETENDTQEAASLHARDTERLNWLETRANISIWEELSRRWSVMVDSHNVGTVSAPTLRDAIDAAIKAVGVAGERVDVCDQSGAGSTE